MESIKCSGFEEIQYEEQQTVEGGFLDLYYLQYGELRLRWATVWQQELQ